MCMCVSICVHMCAGAPGGQKEMSDPLKVELEEVSSHLMWELGAELESTKPAS